MKTPNLDDIFGRDGILSRTLDGFEERSEQGQMAEGVRRAFEREEIALIEAGTGTGKSLAYLVPAVLAAVREQKRTVISTHTINLQEQLVNKDIPMILKALNAEVQAVLVKGMGNYACRRKAEDAMAERKALSEDEADQIESIHDWLDETEDGTRSDLPFFPLPMVWEKIGAEFDACGHRQCPFYKDCFFFEARKRAEEAQLLVVNHHILLADLALKEQATEEEAGILPEYDCLVIDEAHHLEEVATAVWASEVSRAEVVRQLGRLATDKRSVQESGKLALLGTKLRDAGLSSSGEVDSLLKRLQLDLPAEKRRLVTEVNETFHRFLQFFHQQAEAPVGGELKLRLQDEHREEERWQEELVPQVENLTGTLTGFVESLRSLERDVRHLGSEQVAERTRSVLMDIRAVADRLDRMASDMKEFAFGELDPNLVKWIEWRDNRGFANLRLVGAALDVSALLAERLFGLIPSVVLTSATLTTAQNFRFVRERLGLTEELLGEKDVREAVFESPFEFEEQALFVVPKDMPGPSHPSFNREAAEAIYSALKAFDGNAFVLFTSFAMLKACHLLLEERLESEGFVVMRQGEATRQRILQRFKRTDRSVLFGTDSFWEGVDVSGEALRCVIIAKLPFRVPTEPIIQARVEAIEQQGGNAFVDYTVPQAIVKLKQGIGRLIRHRQDRGCIVCLDSRLLTKPYGKTFLNSLPSCSRIFDDKSLIGSRMKRFYLDTDHLICK